MSEAYNIGNQRGHEQVSFNDGMTEEQHVSQLEETALVEAEKWKAYIEENEGNVSQRILDHVEFLNGMTDAIQSHK